MCVLTPANVSAMSLEHSPTRAAKGASLDEDSDYWFRLIDEKDAGAFVDLSARTMQTLRQRGGGPKYVFVSKRCLKYRRFDLKLWAEGRLRSSTADEGTDS